MDSNKYDELADQLFNLVDNNQSDIDSFYTAQHAPQGQEQQQISQWFDNNVNPDEFDGLLNKDAQQTKDGFINWLTTDGADYFNNDNYVMNNDNINTTETTADNNLDTDSIKEYFEKGFKAIANKQTTAVRLGFDDYGNIVPQFGGKPKYVVGVYAKITE